MPIAFAAWGLRYGPISEGLCVLHRCDNPGCCNPNHLFVGTQRRNIEDRDSKGRQARGEKQHLAKLTWLDVCLIRLLGLVRMSQCRIARRFHVNQPNVGCILRGETWKETPEEQQFLAAMFSSLGFGAFAHDLVNASSGQRLTAFADK
jgi:hypothetical protein